MDTTTPAAPPAPPEIDPELTELEAGNAEAATSGRSSARVMTERLLRTVLGRREAKGTPTVSAPHEKAHRDKRRGMSPDRAVRRAVSQAERTADRSRSPHARLGRAKPKKSQTQLHWEFREAARQALSRIKLVNIQVHCPELKFVVGVPGLRTVWQLSQASNELIHAIPGLGPKRRKAILTYLHQHQVPTKWTA